MDWFFYGMPAAAVVIVLVAVLLYRRRNWQDAGKSLDDTLAACRSLLALIADFQQHRGMSTAWLAGDATFKLRLDAKATEIEALIPSLREMARRESRRPYPCLTLNELTLFQFNWGRLRETLAGLSVEQSIAQHSFLIDQLLQWLAALGEARIELLVSDDGQRGLVRNYAIRLPALTECLGQARALGTSVAARGRCSAVARVRLMFLVARAEALLNQAIEAAGGGARAEAATHAVQAMARAVRTQMLLSSGITVAAPAYFSLATVAIDSVFVWISESGIQITQGGVWQRVTQHPKQLQHA